jgi:alkylhydroperoxidase family enzyme
MFLPAPPENSAVGALYEEGRSSDGYVMNLIRLWAWRPDVYEVFLEARETLRAKTTLSAREIAILNATTASRLGDAYCSIAWGTRLANLSDIETATALLRREETPALDVRERALVDWSTKIVGDPNATTREDVEALVAAGFSEREVVEATMFVSFRLAFGTFNSALGARPDRQLADAAAPGLLASITYGRSVDDVSTVA